MSEFTTRVELHDATGDDYELLHSAMEEEGFSRLIEGGSGAIYQMPWAEYNLSSGSMDRSDVLSAAKRAADSTGRTYGVLVTESAGRTWQGLDKVRR